MMKKKYHISLIIYSIFFLTISMSCGSESGGISQDLSLESYIGCWSIGNVESLTPRSCDDGRIAYIDDDEDFIRIEQRSPDSFIATWGEECDDAPSYTLTLFITQNSLLARENFEVPENERPRRVVREHLNSIEFRLVDRGSIIVSVDIDYMEDDWVEDINFSCEMFLSLIN